MKKRIAAFALVLILLLCGCSKQASPAKQDTVETTSPAEETVPATVPEDGDPKDVTCKGSYTGAAAPETIVAKSGDAELSNEQLSVWYWAEVAQYRQERHETEPDYDRPLDVQPCEIDAAVNSWQQYFLKQALSSWHTAQALVQHSEKVPLTFEEAYLPNRTNTEKYMTGMPVTEVLYGYASHYQPNSMHQAYLDGVPRMLTELAAEKGYKTAADMAKEAFATGQRALESFVYSYNRGYMYFTHLSHYIEPNREELDAFYAEHASRYSEEGMAVDFRQILLIPEGETAAQDGTVTATEDTWLACEAEAEAVLAKWNKGNRGTEATFGETAHHISKDTGMGENGGLYRGIQKGQLTGVLDTWCFDPARQPGDTAIVRSAYGVHILYFSAKRENARIAAEADYYRAEQEKLLTEAREMFPLEVTYSSIVIPEAAGTISAGELLYGDVAHERYPEVPLYLQQDYPKTMYGGFKITTNGCGITSFAMLASYMADDELTPPEMCDAYGRYSHSNGTDGMIFNIESAVLGFYMKEKTYDPKLAKAALDEGKIVISVQHPGYWTRAGHYIVCEKTNESGLIQVRDSNIYNYSRIREHKQDEHKWGNITSNGSGFWIFDDKITTVTGCSRCGSPDGLMHSLLHTDYICEKCETALLRRNTYLN